MSKKNKPPILKNRTDVRPGPVISARGRKTIYAGIGAVMAGFALLSLADPGGENFAASAAPFIIIGGYAAIGFGIILSDAPQSGDTARKTAARDDDDTKAAAQNHERVRPAGK